jgi:hypothetical protein
MKGKITAVNMLVASFIIVILIVTILCAIAFMNYSGGKSSNMINDTSNNKSAIYYYSKAYKPFTDADYYIDPMSKIVLTKQKEERRNGYDIDVRGLTNDMNWTSEFFCEPDTIVIAYNNNSYAKTYLGYLVWIDDVYLSDNQVIISLLHLNNFGNLGTLINPVALNTINYVPVDIEGSYNHFLGSNVIETTVNIRNMGDSNLTIVYVYQDAAYLWFPRQNQNGVLPVFYSKGAGEEEFLVGNYTAYSLKGEDRAFAGYADKEHGIISGIVSTTPGIKVGILPEYIGLNGDAEGYVLMSNQNITFTDIPDETFNGSIAPDVGLKNLYVAFELTNMAPGETRSIHYYRLMMLSPEKSMDNGSIQSFINNEIINVTSSYYEGTQLPNVKN